MEKEERTGRRFRRIPDEMNLAEFPLAVMGKRPPRGVKTLTFRDEITDRETGDRVPRELTVTGSDLLGLPTSYNEEVLIGLEELTHEASSPNRSRSPN